MVLKGTMAVMWFKSKEFLLIRLHLIDVMRSNSGMYRYESAKLKGEKYYGI